MAASTMMHCNHPLFNLLAITIIFPPLNKQTENHSQPMNTPLKLLVLYTPAATTITKKKRDTQTFLFKLLYTDIFGKYFFPNNMFSTVQAEY